ncbi:MAG: aldo/keto reductase [Lachnospiraceae bacterium]|nr:aldo/keto reductase [Lachnospiraceae bacterium]
MRYPLPHYQFIPGKAPTEAPQGVTTYFIKYDIALQAWSPLQQGFFGGCFLGSKDYPELNALLEKMAAEKGVTPDTIAYAWILRLPGKVQAITGTTKPARIASAAAAGDIELTRREWYDLYLAAGKKLP